jgi:hypothetical protein
MTVTAKCLSQGLLAPNGSQLTVYTAPADTRTIIDKVSACNTDGSARTITIWIVEYLDSVATKYKVIAAQSINAGATATLDVQNQILNAGDFIAIEASAASVVSVRISGREITT